MNAKRGTIFQLAYVIQNVEQAIHHWTRVMGVGPFFMFPLPLEFDWLELDGRRVHDHDILGAAALAWSGDVQIELLVPGTAPSPYREFLDSGRSGVQHVGMYASDYDAEMADARARGLEVAMEGVLPLSRFAYLRTDTVFPGTMLELIEPQPMMIDLFDQIREASMGWDGRDPVRQLG